VEEIQRSELPQGANMAEWALAWCLKQPAITCVTKLDDLLLTIITKFLSVVLKIAMYNRVIIWESNSHIYAAMFVAVPGWQGTDP
jgi:hypothetical protein